MAKAAKEKPTPKQYAEKVSINVDFHEAMKLLAHHANTKGTKKITYKGRARPTP
jgi:hypothetical protein